MIDLIVEDYLNKGWAAPIPLPAGDKYPPPLRTTGNVPHLERDEILALWEGRTNSNLGLRLQGSDKWEVISLDVDHYGNKRGASHLENMEKELGDLNLNETPRSTRRGIDSPSAQFFFRVPAGFKWKSDACPDVDIVQMTHRYAAVWPSEVDGKQYTWYQGREEISVPELSDLPELPERWVNFLKKSDVGKLVKNRKKNISGRDGYRSAIQWLRENIPGWDNGDENMSQSLRKVSDSQEFLEGLSGNGHDSMVSAVHAAVMLGVEGHLGLKSALWKIEKNFIDEVTLRAEKPRSEAEAKKEFQSAVVGEVDRLIADVAEGNVTITEFSADLALPGFNDLLVRTEAEKRPRDVNLQDYPNTDLGHAMMVRDYWRKDILTVAGGDRSEEFAVWNPSTCRFEFRDTRRVFSYIGPATWERIHHVADIMEERAEGLKSIAETRQLREGEDDPDDIEAAVMNLRRRAESIQATGKMKAILEQMHGFDEQNVDIDTFDSEREIIGLKGGEVLDLLSLRLGDDFVRKGRQADLMTKSTSVHLVPHAKSAAWDEFLDDFLPDKELRAFTQKVIGYSLVAGNPDKKIIFLFGPSNTGKTTILEAVAKSLGDYAGPINAIKLFGSSSGGPSPELVESLNKRMVFTAEVGDDHQLSANSVKRITGNDSQHLRQLHSNVMRSAAPKFTPYISTNSVPDIRGVDQATKERIMVIPFEEVHARKRITEDNDLKSERNLTAILWWVVEGCLRYFEEGMDPKNWPERVLKASGMFTTDTSPLQEFLDDTLIKTEKKNDKIGLEDLFSAWENWCIRGRVDKTLIGSVNDFKKKLTGNGWEVARGSMNGKTNVWFVRYAKMA